MSNFEIVLRSLFTDTLQTVVVGSTVSSVCSEKVLGLSDWAQHHFQQSLVQQKEQSGNPHPAFAFLYFAECDGAGGVG